MGGSIRATEVEAVVQSIRVETRTLVIISAKAKSPHEMAWNNSTSFVEDDHLVDAAKLRARIHVKLYYRSPFFGKPYSPRLHRQFDGLFGQSGHVFFPIGTEN